MAQQANDVVIVGGPSKFDIMVSLFAAERDRRKVVFEVQLADDVSKVSAEFVIASVERADSSGESWLLQGFRLTSYEPGHRPGREVLVPFEGHFSTKLRKGHLTESPRR